jgi:hypothetical protein
MPFGNAVGQGFVNPSIVVANKVIIEGSDDYLFVYSGSPALGNLIASIAAVAGTDPYGNAYPAGFTSFASATFLAQLLAGVLNFQATAGQPLPASFGSSVAGAAYMFSGEAGAGDTPAEILAESSQASGQAGGLIELLAAFVQMGNTGAGTVTILNNCVITGTLSVNGSPDTSADGLPNGGTQGTSASAGLTNGQIAGTSGAQSAGTAHTHGPGSYAVTNGQHTHGPGSYSVTNGVHSHTL